jgi:hypothetical protein
LLYFPKQKQVLDLPFPVSSTEDFISLCLRDTLCKIVRIAGQLVAIAKTRLEVICQVIECICPRLY